MISIDLFKTDGRFVRGMCNTKIIYSAITTATLLPTPTESLMIL